MKLPDYSTVLNIRTPHPITGMHRDSKVSLYLKKVFYNNVLNSNFITVKYTQNKIQ